MKRQTRVMVFGAFDGLHAGHRAFLRQAGRYGHLIIVVARDHVILRLKGRRPHFSERTRANHMRGAYGAGMKVILGDQKLGTYSAIAHYRPNIICLGYDQTALYRDLRARMRKGTLPRVTLRRLKPHAPHRYHSSLLH